MASKTIWALPQIEYQSLKDVQEKRPAALLTDAESWAKADGRLSLPLVVQAEPERADREFIDYLSQNVPSLVEVVYVVGSGDLVPLGKIVAHNNNLPLVIVPTELDSDQFLEPHVELLDDNILTNIYTGAAEKVIVDWEIIQAADPHRRAGLLADLISIVTGLLDWRHAAKLKRTGPNEPFVPWAAGVSAGLASEAIKRAEAIGRGEVEALSTLLDLASVSVQLANQLGHARQQEGSEHYFALELQKLHVNATHAELLGPAILFVSAMHNQDPSALRDALEKAGIRLNQIRPADLQLAISDIAGFAAANSLPYGIAHEIDPFSDAVSRAMELAKLSGDTGAWAATPPPIPTPDSTGEVAPLPPQNAGQ